MNYDFLSDIFNQKLVILFFDTSLTFLSQFIFCFLYYLQNTDQLQTGGPIRFTSSTCDLSDNTLWLWIKELKNKSYCQNNYG